jgi:hypothetical protein
MEDKGLGSLIFYIILAVIVLAGSLQGRKKKVPPRKAASPSPAAGGREPAGTGGMSRGQEFESAASPGEAMHAEPVDGAFSEEGSGSEPMAGAFAMEGSINDTMAAAFATEGISSLTEAQVTSPEYNAITDSEISDDKDYQYSIAAADDIVRGGFDLRKAVIYSAVLNRKEYSF